MKKLIVIFTMIITFISVSTPTKASMSEINNMEGTSDELIQPYSLELLNDAVKFEANRQCRGGVDARSINSVEVIENSTNESDIEVQSSSGWSDQNATSDAGSKIRLTSERYCHIFMAHMQWANGYQVENVYGSTQFAFATYPASTMDIIMQVVDGTTKLDPVNGYPNRKSKHTYSSIAGTRVFVVLEKPSNTSSYDWKVITAYPK